MRTRNVRKSTWAVVISEITVAAHLLLLLPPATQAAPAPSPMAEESAGEAALSTLAIVRAAPAPQEPVQVNETVPDVEPPPAYPTFSPNPTDGEITKARVFGEPLIPEAGESDEAENRALAQAITTYLYGGDSEALEPLEGIVTTYPRSRWRVSVQANVGSWYRRKGYFTRAQRNLSEAWRLGKDSDTEGVRRLAEFAAGELMLIHMQFGQVDPLEALTVEFSGRELSGGITEKLYAAQATVWGLRNEHERAIPSASVALERLRLDEHERKETAEKERDPSYQTKTFVRHPELERFPATHDGASLADVQDLAELANLELQMARRESPNADIPLPAVVHLKQGHFAALVEKRGERFRLDDPLLGGELWLSREAFEEEISGFFLLGQGRLAPGWRTANRTEAEPIRGKCIYAVGYLGETRQCNGGCPGGPGGAGMATYSFHQLRASLSITDNPVGYSPPRGPDVRFRATYNQREAGQPATFSYSNLGQRWVHDWMSYVEDDPTAIGDPVTLYVRGGGYEPYDGFVNGVSAPQQDIRAIMTIVSTDPITYEREMPDGSTEVFTQSDGASTAPRRVFLTEWKDPQGNELTFTYDSELRLVSATDAIGQVTTISYELAGDPLKITKVTDPFGRFASFAYDDDGQLVAITDVIGLTSSFEYGVNVEYLTATYDFVRALTTPYGTTTFRSGIGPYAGYNQNRWVEATDPLGGTERVEHILSGTNPLPASDPANTVPTGFTGNAHLNTHVSIYYSKLAMDRATTDPPDPTTGVITRYRSSGQFQVSGYQIHSTKQPLENRVWYEQFGEPFLGGVGPDGRPAMIGRVLDDGTSQISRYEYNSRGETTRATGPLGRTTLYNYASNEIDLTEIRQVKGATTDLLWSATYNGNHRILTQTDASGQTWTYTYNDEGQLLTITTPPRAGITENRTTTQVYDSDGYLESVTAPAAGATSTYTYDSYGRTRTVTDSDGYSLTYDYDAMDRPTKTTYPDGSYTETQYNRLDAERQRDRLGRWTHTFRDTLRRVVAVRDPLGRTTTWEWCTCGSLERLIDPNGNATSWERDDQGRVTRVVRADGSDYVYTYEDTTSRLESVEDPEEQVITVSYLLDDNWDQVTYTNTNNATPSVTLGYDSVYNRLTTVTDGVGTTTYSYHPVTTPPVLGAARLASIDGSGSSDVITYSYDEVGRVKNRSINGVALASTFDALGRLTSESNALGTFTYDYDGLTHRLTDVSYPNGQTTRLTYFGNLQDRRLQEIHHKLSSGATLSRFEYAHDVQGTIKAWTQQAGTDPEQVYDLEHDAVDQLTAATLQTIDPTPTILKRYRYAYDIADNRAGEQVDDASTIAAHNALNALTSVQPGGAMLFAGTLNEPSTVTVQGKPALVTAADRFSGTATTGSGTTEVVVEATDASGNTRTNTYEVTLSGSAKTLSYDANGNLTSDGTRTFEWDGANRLITIIQGTDRSEFTYDGWGRRVKIVEKDNGVVTSDRRFLWCGLRICEERTSGGSVVRRFYAQGMEENGTPFFYARDHLGSVRELTDSSGAVRARYDYDPYGRATKVSGDKDSVFTFTGHFWHAPSALALAPFRAYDPQLGRWMTQDPIGFAAGMNFYSYAGGRPIDDSDPLGLFVDGGFTEGLVLTGASVAAEAAGIGLGAALGAVAVAGAVGIGIGTLIDQTIIKPVFWPEEPPPEAPPPQPVQPPDPGQPPQPTQPPPTSGPPSPPQPQEPPEPPSPPTVEPPSTRTVPKPKEPKCGCTCICRADADDTMPGNIKPGKPRFAFGMATASNCAIAKKAAKKLAAHNLGMKPKHTKCRCAGK